MRLVFTILTGLLIVQASAAQQCVDVFAKTIEAPQDRELTFKKVQVYRLNNKMGQQQVGELKFLKWIEVGPFAEGVYNHIGLTAEGRLYHLVEWKDQKVARLLSGDQSFTQFFLLNNQILAAVDQHNQVQLYAPAKWVTSSISSTLKRGAVYTATISVSVSAAVAYLIPDAMSFGFHVGDIMVPVSSAMITAVTALNTFFVMVNRYDRLNTFPDGFVGTGIEFKDPISLQKELGKIDHNSLRTYFSGQALQPPDKNLLDPEIPELATEDIR